MGTEYKIRFAVPQDFSTARLSSRLPDARVKDSEWVEYAFQVEPDGFYFVDHGGNKETSCTAFRCLVDEALRHQSTVEIEKL